MTAREIQAALRKRGVTQRDLVKSSGLSESVVSVLVRYMPKFLPHLTQMLGKNPFIEESEAQGEKMATSLKKLSQLRTHSISDPVRWQRQQRKDRPLPGRAAS